MMMMMMMMMMMTTTTTTIDAGSAALKIAGHFQFVLGKVFDEHQFAHAIFLEDTRPIIVSGPYSSGNLDNIIWPKVVAFILQSMILAAGVMVVLVIGVQEIAQGHNTFSQSYLRQSFKVCVCVCGGEVRAGLIPLGCSCCCEEPTPCVDDLLLAPDFLFYFRYTAWLLREDCVLSMCR
eukprot:2315218-Amphidinium_carterae.1